MAPETGTLKYSDVLTATRIKIRDTAAGSKLTDTDGLSLLVDGVQLVWKILAFRNPEMIWQTSVINLTVVGGIGPYAAPGDFMLESMIMNDDTPPKQLKVGSRSNSKYLASSGQPRKYWIEGFGKFFFDRIPDQSRTFTLYYIPILARTAAVGDLLPLPDYFFEVLDNWLVKMSGIRDEYATMDEDQKMGSILPMVEQILRQRAPEVKLDIDGVNWNSCTHNSGSSEPLEGW